MDFADVVIVGAGSAGCTLAARLTESGARRVVVLEAGGNNEAAQVRQPSLWPALWDTAHNWGYSTTLQPGYGGRSIAYPRGKGLGGTSAINTMIYIRGDARDFDHWRDEGNPGWGWSDVLPLFLKSEDQARGTSARHATGGPLHVSDLQDPCAASLSFIEAAAQCGYSPNPDFNGETQLGAGLYQVTADSAGRVCTARAFLAPAMQRANLRVITRARTLRVLYDGRKATGVEYFRDAQVHQLMAGEVILCAGAIDSPKLLMLSGIGDPAQLEPLGVPVAHALPGVGRDLHDHPGSAVVLRLRDPAKLPPASNIAEAGLFLHSGIEHDGYDADTQMFFLPRGPLLAAATGAPWAMMLNAQTNRPRSRGSVRLRSCDPADPPLIDPAYLTDPYDVKVQLNAVRAARRIAGAKPLRSYWSVEVLPGASVQEEDALIASIRANSGCIWHPVGTCRMGTGKHDVVDSALRVHGIERLRVADASIMPRITSGNTNAPAIMIAEKAAMLVEAGESSVSLRAPAQQ